MWSTSATSQISSPFTFNIGLTKQQILFQFSIHFPVSYFRAARWPNLDMMLWIFTTEKYFILILLNQWRKKFTDEIYQMILTGRQN